MPTSQPSFTERNAGPLLSWDFFQYGYQRLMARASDLAIINKMAKAGKWNVAWDIKEELMVHDSVIVITDIKNKIVFASSNIISMTGYAADEVQGKNPKMFQGPGTSQSILNQITDKISKLEYFDHIVLNYKKNGQPYYCHIKGHPVFNNRNQLVNFIAFEKAA